MLNITILFTALGLTLVSYSDVLAVFLLSVCMCSTLVGEGEYESLFFSDNLSGTLLSLTIFLTITIILTLQQAQASKTTLLLLSGLICEALFLTSNLIFFFILFEVSLIPMFILIVSWSNSPERFVASKYMVLYTFFASVPLLFLILSLSGSGVRAYCSFWSDVSIWSLFGCLAFLVNAPLFFFHSWLPRAHVEAPLEGSMILAGLMLKLGGYGLMRLCNIFQIKSISEGGALCLLFSICMVGCVWSIVIAISSDDLNVSVAYSSVGHMNITLAGVCCLSIEAFDGSLVAMLSHGLSSPLLFYCVTLAYSMTHSRSVLMNNGVLGNLSPFNVFFLIVWGMNIAIPPFVSFLGELNICTGIVSIQWALIVIILLFMVLGSAFSAINFGLLSQSSGNSPWKGEFSLLNFTVTVTIFSEIMIFLFATWFTPSIIEVRLPSN